jgi:hypothetical protein
MRYSPVPEGPVELGEVLRRFPTIHQSLASSFDDCALSALFQIAYGQGWHTKDQARGQIWHRFAAEALREMQRHDSETIPTGVALSILEDVLRQREVEPAEIVRLPLREIPKLRMAAKKFAKDNRFSVRKIIDIERRLFATLSYQLPDGSYVERALTGQLDLLMVHRDRGDEAVVVDWKDTWALPPERHEDAEDPGLSYHGYFQQLFYGWLVMKNYPSIEAVTLREFYARRTKARAARITRSDLESVEAKLAILVESIDRALASGKPKNLKLETLAETEWEPSPGKHCYNCVASHRCPIEDDAALPKTVRTPEHAARWAAARQVAVAVKKRADQLLHPYADLHGPIPIKFSKGRRVLGHRPLTNGKTRFEEYTPEGSDRPPTRTAEDEPLVDALRESAERKRAAA